MVRVERLARNSGKDTFPSLVKPMFSVDERDMSDKNLNARQNLKRKTKTKRNAQSNVREVTSTIAHIQFGWFRVRNQKKEKKLNDFKCFYSKWVFFSVEMDKPQTYNRNRWKSKNKIIKF